MVTMRMRIVSKVSLTAVLFLLVGVVPAQAATPSLSGKVVDLANKSIVGVEQAFKKVYGVEWNEAEPILAQVVSKELS